MNGAPHKDDHADIWLFVLVCAVCAWLVHGAYEAREADRDFRREVQALTVTNLEGQLLLRRLRQVP